jgi:hypothetical protein
VTESGRSAGKRSKEDEQEAETISFERRFEARRCDDLKRHIRLREKGGTSSDASLPFIIHFIGIEYTPVCS